MLDSIGMSKRVAAGDEAAETVTEQNHFRNVHGFAPSLEEPHILLFNFVRIVCEVGSRALAKAEQIDSVHWMVRRELIKVQHPEGESADVSLKQEFMSWRSIPCCGVLTCSSTMGVFGFSVFIASVQILSLFPTHSPRST